MRGTIEKLVASGLMEFLKKVYFEKFLGSSSIYEGFSQNIDLPYLIIVILTKSNYFWMLLHELPAFNKRISGS